MPSSETMTYLHALSAPAALLMAAFIVASPVDARPQIETANADTAATEQAAEAGAEAQSLSTGSIDLTPAAKRKKQFDDCMAIWEPATHMTKKEWRRTCNNTTEDDVPNL
jgi:hypothetical protein